MIFAYFILKNSEFTLRRLFAQNKLQKLLTSRPICFNQVIICLFSEDPALRSFSCQEHIRKTQTYRTESSSKDLLFMFKIKPHKPVKICTIDNYAKDGRPGVVCPSCSFHHDPLWY